MSFNVDRVRRSWSRIRPNLCNRCIIRSWETGEFCERCDPIVKELLPNGQNRPSPF